MAALLIMDIPLMLADFSSRDVSRIRGACAEVHASWDREALSKLAVHIQEIKATTEDIEWGGILINNAVHLHDAIQRMEYARSNDGCFCRVCDMFDNPERLQERGHVTINEFAEKQRTFQVSCNECGATYEVEELESHYPWWQWNAKKEQG